MIQLLLSLGAHPDVIDFAGRTALMHAAEYGHVNAMQLLREARADPKIQDLEGRGKKNPRKSNFRIDVKCFVLRFLDAIYYCFTEATQRHKTCLKLLLTMGANVNSRTRAGVPNLVHACQNSEENEEFCLALIEAGADVHLVDEVICFILFCLTFIIALLFLFKYSIKRKQNEQLFTMLVSREMQKLFVRCYALKLIPTSPTVNYQHQHTKQQKVVILRSVYH